MPDSSNNPSGASRLIIGMFGVMWLVATVLVVMAGRTEAEDNARRIAHVGGDTIALGWADVLGGAEHELRGLTGLAALRTPTEIVRGAAPGELRMLSWVVPRDGRLTVESGRLDLAVVESDQLAIGTVQARDRAEPVSIVLAGETPMVLMVAPLYEDGEILTSTSRVPGTAGRRETLAGFLVGIVDPAGLVSSRVGGWQLTTGDVVLASEGEAVGESAARAIDISDHRWIIRAWKQAAPVSDDAVIALFGLVVVGAAGAVMLVSERRRRARLVAEVDAERERSAVVADLAPTLQRSLELSDVLPIVALQLSDRFGLTGISVVTSSDGGTNEVFSHGIRPDDVPPSIDLGSSLNAGQTASLALTRAGRLVAELRMRAGRPLNERDLQSIQAAAELATSAIVTAQALERQRRAVDRLTELDAVKNVFLTTAAHELRTPVAAIKGFGGLLRDQWDALSDEERRLTASRVAANADGLNALVQDLLDFSRLETGRLTVAPEPIDLAAFVATTVDRLSAAWAGHELEVETVDGPPVVGDPVAFERVLTNLLSNAARYSPHGTTIRVSVVHDARHGVLQVDDEGPGVPPEERERIFDRFYRGTGQAVVETRGVGIGLAVVREYIRQLGGSVTVSEAPSGGARFECRFAHHTALPAPASPNTEGATT